MADTYDDNPFLTIAARSYARGFVPEPEEETPPPARSKGKDKKTQRGFLSEAASALGAGVVGAGEAVAGLGEMAGIPGADTAREYLKGLQESEALRRPDYLAGPETILDKPERALDWRWWTRAVGENLPNMAAMLIPGAAALKMAKAAKWGLAGKTLAVKAGPWAGSFPLESGAAYGQAKDEMIKSGRYDADTIERIATLEGIAVGTVNALLEGLPGEKLLLKQVGADRILKRIVRQAMLEGGTETAQEAVNILAEQLGHQPDITMKQAIGRALEAGIVGGVLGGGAGGTVGTYVHKQNTKQYQGLADQLNLTNDIYAWKDAGVDDKEIAGRVAERLDAVRLMQQGERPLAGERQYGLEEERPLPDLAAASEDMAAGRPADQPLVETGQAVTDAARTEQIKAAQSTPGTEIAKETQEEPAKAEQIGEKEAAAAESGKGPEKKPFVLPEIDTEEMVSYVLYAGKKPRYEPPPGLWEDFAAGAAAAKRKMLAAFGMKPRTAAAESQTGSGRPAVAVRGSMVDGAQAVTDIGTAPGRQAKLDEAAAQQQQKQARKAGANMLAGAVLEENADTQERAAALAAAQQGLSGVLSGAQPQGMTGAPGPGAAETPSPGSAPTAAPATPAATTRTPADFLSALGDLTPEGQAQAEAALAARRQAQEEEQVRLAAAAASQNEVQIAAAQKETQDLLARIAGEDPEKRRIAGEILTGMSDRVLVAAVRKPPTDAKEPGLGLPVRFDDRGVPALNGLPVDLHLLRTKLAETRVATIDAKRTKDEQDRQAVADRQDMLRQQRELRAARSVLKYFPAQMPSEREIMILDNAAATPGRLTTGELQTLAQIKKRISATGKKAPPASVQTLTGKPAGTAAPTEEPGAAAVASVAPAGGTFSSEKRGIPAETLMQIKALADQGKGAGDIAAQLGLDRQQVMLLMIGDFFKGDNQPTVRTKTPASVQTLTGKPAPASPPPASEPPAAKQAVPAHEEAMAAGALESEEAPDLETQIDEMHLDFMIGTAEMALETPSGKLDTQEDTKWLPFGGWITAMTKQGMDKKEIASILKKARAGQRLTGLQEQKLAAMKNAAADEAAEAEKAAAQIHYEGHGYIPVGEDIVLAPPESETAEYDPTEPGTRFVIGGQEFVLKDPGKLSAGTILKNVEYVKPARAAEEEGFAFGEEAGGESAFGEEEAAPARQEEAAAAPSVTENIEQVPEGGARASGEPGRNLSKAPYSPTTEKQPVLQEYPDLAATINPSTTEIVQPGATSKAGTGTPVNNAEKGVALYARGGEENRGGETTMTREDLEKHARQLLGDSKNQPELLVVEKASDLPFEALEDAKGVLFDGKMYLVAEQIALPEDADETIFHEFIGHFGLNGFFGEKIRPALDSIHVHNPLVRQYTNEWMKSNRDFQEKYGVSDLDYHYRAIEEAMARMAQENKPFTFAKRLLSSVQTLLRKAGMTRLADSLEAKTNAEALTMLHKAGLYIKKGKTVDGNIPEPLYPYYLTGEPDKGVEMYAKNEPADTATPRLAGDNLNELVSGLTKAVKGLTVLGREDNGVKIKTKSGQIITVQSVERIEPDRIALELGYRGQTAAGKSIAGAYLAGAKAAGKPRTGQAYLVRNKAGIWTLTHEFYHFLEDIGAISNADKVLLNNKIAALVAKDPEQYKHLLGRSNAEARAEWVGRTLAGVYDAKTPTGKIIQKIKDFIDRIVNALGIRTPAGAIRDIKAGRVYDQGGLAGVRKQGTRYQVDDNLGEASKNQRERITEKALKDLAQAADAEVFVDRGAFGMDRVRIRHAGERKGFDNLKTAYDYLFSVLNKEVETANLRAMSKDKGPGAIPAKETPTPEAGRYESVRKFIADSIADKQTRGSTEVRPVNAKEIADIKEVVGVDVSKAIHEVTSDDLRHTINQHGDVKKEAKRGQIAVTVSDLERIPEILDSYDRIEKGTTDERNRKSVRYIKKNNGETTYVEVVIEGGNKLRGKTMWKTPSGRINAPENPNHTSETAAGPGVDSKLTPASGNVKSENLPKPAGPSEEAVPPQYALADTERAASGRETGTARANAARTPGPGEKAENLWREKVAAPVSRKIGTAAARVLNRIESPEKRRRATRFYHHFREFWNPGATLPHREEWLAARARAMGNHAEALQFIDRVFKQLDILPPEIKHSLFQVLDGQVPIEILPESMEVNVPAPTGKLGELKRETAAAAYGLAGKQPPAGATVTRTVKPRELARQLRARSDTIGRIMVDIGILDEKQFAAWEGRYVHYMYGYHILGDDAPIAVGNGGRVDLSETLGRNKDLTPEQRRELGWIEDAAIAVPVGMGKALTDIAKWDYLAKIAANPEWVWQPGIVSLPLGKPLEKPVKGRTRRYVKLTIGKLVAESAKYEELARLHPNAEIEERSRILKEALDRARQETANIPEDFVQINGRSYGPLDGAYVRKPIADDLTPVLGQFTESMGKAAKTILEVSNMAMAAFKMGKVALNPPTAFRNVISNIIQVNLSGLSLPDTIRACIAAAESMKTQDNYHAEARRMGLFNTSWAATEINDILDEFRKAEGGRIDKLLVLVKHLAKYYGGIDDFFKLALYRSRREAGASMDAAAVHALKWGMDYSLASRSVKTARRFYMPFLTYFYKITPLLAEAIAKRPWTVAKYALIPAATKMLAMGLHDLDDDDWEELERQLPQYIKKSGSMIVMPWKTDKDQWQWVNLEYFFPWGNWFNPKFPLKL